MTRATWLSWTRWSTPRFTLWTSLRGGLGLTFVTRGGLSLMRTPEKKSWKRRGEGQRETGETWGEDHQLRSGSRSGPMDEAKRGRKLAPERVGPKGEVFRRGCICLTTETMLVGQNGGMTGGLPSVPGNARDQVGWRGNSPTPTRRKAGRECQSQKSGKKK